ncbi:MAG: hypothetical protein GF375_05070, partial [Candidatus Omnitrophica bacterium]|nr:hypothetical protein [Candidatus Omnitrophota bacterium]MBD3269366.1 hypothetical protein [Candidatus Omnitrophota bacterium]
MRSKALIFSVTFMIMCGGFFSEAGAREEDKYCKDEMRKAAVSSVDFKERLLRKIYFLLANSEEIGLTKEQVSRVKDAKFRLKKSLLLTEAEIEIATLDIQAKLAEEAIDLGTVNSLIDKKYKLKATKEKILIEVLADLKNILTLE